MGVIIRQSITTTIIAYIGAAIGYINLLYLFPRFLSPEQVGVMRTVQDAAILMAQFAQFGLAQSIIRFYPRFSSSKEQSHNFFNLIILLATIGFGVFLLIYLIFSNPILSYFKQNAGDFIQYSRLALYLTFTIIMTTLFEVYSRSLLKNVVPNLLKEVVTRLLLGILVMAYFMGYIDFEQMMKLSVLIYILCLIILSYYLYSGGHLSSSISIKIIPSHVFKDLLYFSLLSFAGTAGLIVIGKVDSLMVASLLGLAPVAIYTTAFYMATVIEIPKRAITQLSSPLIARGFEKNDQEEIKRIYHKSALNQFIIGTLLLIGIIANLDSIFALMPKGDIYQAGKWVVIIVGAGKLTDMLFGPSSEIIIYSKYYWFNIVLIILLAVVLITANNLLIPSYGITGAAIGAALALVVFNFVKFIFIWAKLDLQPFSFNFIKVVIIGSAAWICNTWIPRMDLTILDMIVRSTVITIVFGALTLMMKVSPEANDLFKKATQLLRKN